MAYLEARAGLARAGVTYAGFAAPRFRIYIDNVDRTAFCFKDHTFVLTDILDDQPSTLRLRIRETPETGPLTVTVIDTVTMAESAGGQAQTTGPLSVSVSDTVTVTTSASGDASTTSPFTTTATDTLVSVTDVATAIIPFSNRRVLTSADFSYLGFFRLPGNDTGLSLTSSDFQFSGRRVGNEIHFFVLGYNAVLGECIYPGSQSIVTGTDLTSVPQATWYKNWGPIYYRSSSDSTDVRAPVPGNGWSHKQMCWDEAAQCLWWGYQPYYDAWEGCQYAATTFAGTTSYTTWGPWRSNYSNKRLGGFLTIIPPYWANQWVSGKALGFGGGIQSMIGSDAHTGPNIYPADRISLSTAADDGTPGSSAKSLTAGDPILGHFYGYTPTRCKARHTGRDYIICGPNTPNDWSSGTWTADPQIDGHVHDADRDVWLFYPYVHPDGTGADRDVWLGLDAVQSMIWIDTGTHHGLIYAGQYVKPPSGDPTRPHAWYGPSYLGLYQCGHYYEDVTSEGAGTGPRASFKVPMWWIYNPDVLATRYTASADAWSLLESSRIDFNQQQIATSQSPFNLAAPLSYFHQAVSGQWCGFYFDAPTNRLFVCVGGFQGGPDRTTDYYGRRPVVHVWQLPGSPTDRVPVTDVVTNVSLG